ncbi:MAG: polymer-forming cytoskeletal protein [Acidobacteria bacterium]|nr:polymer-forming cytoskeletal protein [Acidobacteriota bacterium]
MWKKNDAPIPQHTPASSPAPVPPPAAAATPSAAPVAPQAARAASSSAPVTIGASVVIKGELSAKEDLTISGRVEGKVEVRDHVVRVGREAKVNAEINARAVIVEGTVTGNINASERIELLEHGSVEGDITSPKISMAEGAEFRGKIDMAAKGAGIKRTA